MRTIRVGEVKLRPLTYRSRKKIPDESPWVSRYLMQAMYLYPFVVKHGRFSNSSTQKSFETQTNSLSEREDKAHG